MISEITKIATIAPFVQKNEFAMIAETTNFAKSA